MGHSPILGKVRRPRIQALYSCKLMLEYREPSQELGEDLEDGPQEHDQFSPQDIARKRENYKSVLK